GRELATGRGTQFVDTAAHRFAYGAAQGDAARRLALGAAHAGHDAVDFFYKATWHDAAGHLVHLAGIKGNAIGGAARATLLTEVQLARHRAPLCQNRALPRYQLMAAMMALAGMVSTQAQTMLPVTPQRTLLGPRAAPTPTMAPVMVCVV